jgi:ribose transport system substrate-binding protein
MRKRNIFGALALALSLSGTATHAGAQGIDDPRRADYFKVFTGKTIAFIPVTMGIDLTEGWASVLKKQADELGMKFEVRDPHFSADAGAQALTSLISEKPDVIIVHNPDVQSYARLLKRAEEAGIHVIQVNMRSNYNSDAYVGADWIGIGEAETQAVVDKCGAGTSGKVAILEGQPTSGSDSGMMKGAENILAKHPEIKVVSNQGADWDATKARSIMATVTNRTRIYAASSGSGTLWISARRPRSRNPANRSFSSLRAAASRWPAIMSRKACSRKKSPTTSSIRGKTSPTWSRRSWNPASRPARRRS